MCQCFRSIIYLNGQVISIVPLYAVTSLIYVMRSFIGGNVCSKWLHTMMAVIKMEKWIRVMSPSKLSRFSFCLWIHERNQLILFLLFVGKSRTGFLLDRFTFSGVLCIPFL
jgi:hypothetical protein